MSQTSFDTSMPAVSPIQRHSFLPASARLATTILAALGVIGMLSLAVAVREAFKTGIDFQWSGARLVGQHIDPWKVFLDGDPQHWIIMGQIPNYLHELYILLLPIGMLSLPRALMVWCFINLAMVAAILLLTVRMFGLDRRHALLLTSLVLASTPFRMTLSNGQHGYLILLLLTLFFSVRNTATRGLFLGLSYAKYSFSPLLVFFLALRLRIVVLLLSAIPPAIGFFLVWHMVHGDAKTLLMEPFVLARTTVGLGYADVMTPIEMILRGAGYPAHLISSIPTLVGMGMAVVCAVVLSRRRDLEERVQFALILLLTLFCFKHLLYDFVVMLVPMALLFTLPASRARIVAFCGILYFWFASTVVNRLEHDLHAATVIVNSVILLATTIALTRAAKKSGSTHAA